MKKGFAPILILLLVVLVSIGYVGYKKYQPTPQTLTIPSPTSFPTSFPSSTELMPTITQDQLNNGWYWGFADQKKPGTPTDWLFSEAGRSSCWHRPGNLCQFTPNMAR